MERLYLVWESINPFIVMGLSFVFLIGMIVGLFGIFWRRVNRRGFLSQDRPGYRDPGRNPVAFLMAVLGTLSFWGSVGSFLKGDDIVITGLAVLVTFLFLFGAWRVFTRSESKMVNINRLPEDASPRTVDEVVDGNWVERY